MHPPVVTPEESKECVFCCTPIPKPAIVCRYCHRDLPTSGSFDRGMREVPTSPSGPVRTESFLKKFCTVFTGLPSRKGE
jgi:hypothetical protein